MSTINTSTYTASTSYSSTVESFKKDAEELIEDQTSIGAGGTYDSFSTSTDIEEVTGTAMNMGSIYSSSIGMKGVTYDDDGGVASVDVKTLTYARMDDHSNMLKLMMGEKPSTESFTDMFSSLLSASSASASSSFATSLTTDDGAYSVDSIATDILDMAEELAGDDLDLLAELKEAALEAFENAGDSSSALTSDTKDKVLAGFDTIEANITASLAEAEASTEDVTTEEV